MAEVEWRARAVRAEKDLGGQGVHIAADFLQHIGDAIHNRFEQAGQHHRPRCTDSGVARRIRNEPPEWQRIGIPVGDELVARQDESNLGSLRQIRVELRNHRGRHVEAAVLLVEAV